MNIHRLQKIFLTPFELPLHLGVYFQRIVFGVAFSLFSFVQWQGHIYILNRDMLLTDMIDVTLKAIIFILLGLKLIFQRYDLLRIVLIAFCSSLVLLSAVRSHDNVLLWTLLFIISAQNVDWKTIGWSCISTSISIIALDIIVNTQNRSVEAIDSRNLHNIRFSLGFSHPNLTALFIFFLVIGVYLIVRNRLFIVFILASAALVVTYVLLSSRTEIIGLAAFIGLIPVMYLQQIKAHKKIVLIVNSFICLLCDALCMLSFFASYFYHDGSEVFRVLNKLFSGRLQLLHGYFHGGGLTLFGRTYSGFSTGMFTSLGLEVNFIADNFYVRSVLLYGLVTGGLLVFLILCIQWYLAVKRSVDFYAFSVPLIMGVAESLPLFVDKNLLLFVLPKMLYKGLQEEEFTHHAKHKLS